MSSALLSGVAAMATDRGPVQRRRTASNVHGRHRSGARSHRPASRVICRKGPPCPGGRHNRRHDSSATVRPRRPVRTRGGGLHPAGIERRRVRHHPPPAGPATASSAQPGPLVASTSTSTIYPAHCQARDNNEEPDPTCTPGALNPAVTQATIGSTICKSGWTATIPRRRPTPARSKPRRSPRLRRLRRHRSGDLRLVEVDH
jgi:hypothetical protein